MSYHQIDELFERMTYPAGESHLRLRDHVVAGLIGEQLVVEFDARSFDDLGQMITADRVLVRSGIEATWFVPYFPFARHDRRIDANDGFELGLAIELVEELTMVIADPHSDVAGQLRHVPQSSVVEVLKSKGAFDNDPIVVVPDAGAAKKVDSWIGTAATVQALKHRDQRTGKLSGFDVLAEDLGGRPCIIVDDICDAGGTFLGLAQQLRDKNAGPLTLAITHGLFTKGTGALSEAFDQIYTFGAEDQGAGSERRVIRIPYETLYEKGAQQ